jgi:hypothetical protein
MYILDKITNILNEKKKKKKEALDVEKEKDVTKAKVKKAVVGGLADTGLMGDFGEKAKEKAKEGVDTAKGKPSREQLIKALALSTQAIISGKGRTLEDTHDLSEVRNAIKLIAKETGVAEDEVDLKSFKYK